MAHPKRRHSNSRTGKRRSHDFMTAQSLSVCSNCGAKIVPHRICGECGFYNGKQQVAVNVKEDE